MIAASSSGSTLIFFETTGASLIVTVIGVYLAYFFATNRARRMSEFQAKEQSRISRQLSMLELQAAFDTMYDNDEARYDTLHDYFYVLANSDDLPPDRWRELAQQAVDHLDSHRPKSVTLVDPEVMMHWKEGRKLT